MFERLDADNIKRINIRRQQAEDWATEQRLFTLHYDEVLQAQTRRGLERYRVQLGSITPGRL